MPTILQLAEILKLAAHAGVSADTVLRVVNGEPVNEDSASRVRDAMAVLGPQPSESAERALEPRPADEPAGRAREQLLERFDRATRDLEAHRPEDVGSVVYEALRVEVRPVAQHVEQLRSLFEEMIRRLEGFGGEVHGERRERTEDVALLVELITSGWRGVDRRLARLERMMERLGDEASERPAQGKVFHLGDPPRAGDA